MKYSKYHALGNDYIVIRPEELADDLNRDAIRLIAQGGPSAWRSA